VAKRTSAAMYYAEDKDVYDLLSSSKKTLNVAALQKLARARGIYLSGADGRDDIVNYLSLLDYDWPQLSSLVELTDTLDRAEKVSGSDIKSKADSAQLLAAAATAKNAIQESSRDDVIQISQTPSTLRIAVQYSEPNFSRTRLHQRRIRDVSITVEKAPGGYRVRHEANAKADAVVQALVAALEAKVPTERRTIELNGIRDAHLRTKFFLLMIQGVAGFKVDTVTSVKVATLPPEHSVGGDEDNEAEEDTTSSRSIKPEEAAVVGHVKSAALTGEDLLQSEEYVALAKKGFFLSRCVWRGSETKGKRRAAEFEAEFSRDAQATGFKYNVRGVYERDDAGELLATKLPAKNHPDLTSALEDSAHAALNKVEKEAVGKRADEERAK
jgi:hypothetical protein